MEHHQKCQNCSRTLTDNELYCYFCELDIEALKKSHKKDLSKKQH